MFYFKMSVLLGDKGEHILEHLSAMVDLLGLVPAYLVSAIKALAGLLIT